MTLSNLHGFPAVFREMAVMVAVTSGILAGAGIVLRPVETPAWEQVRGTLGAVDAGDVEIASGQGVVAGLLGGFRALAADLLWLKANASWENADLPATQTTIRAVTTIDPRPLYFWVNGARMIAFDMPQWRIEQGGGYDVVPESVQMRISEEQAQVALGLLVSASRVHPRNPEIMIEAANIYLSRLGDLDAAAQLYRDAAELPAAPFYAARLHAELLRQLGRLQDALDWLVRVHPVLPADVPEAMPGVVLARIRQLEDELGVPAALRYIPPAK